MANPAPKIINKHFSYLIVSVRRPSHTCASLRVSVSVFLCLTVSFLFDHTTPAPLFYHRGQKIAKLKLFHFELMFAN